mgnify:CR=1 FL=1
MNLRKIFDGSVAYYERDFAGRFGQRIEPQFPGQAADRVGATPGACRRSADRWEDRRATAICRRILQCDDRRGRILSLNGYESAS